MSRSGAKRRSSAKTDDFTISVAKALVQYNRLAEHWNAVVKAQRKPSRELNQAVFRALAVVLRAYHLPANWPAGASPPTEYLPRQIAYDIANYFEYMAAGQLPGPIRDAIEPNRPRAGPQETGDVAVAVSYIRAARKGIVEDHRAVKTIAHRYGVHPGSVKRWMAKHSSLKFDTRGQSALQIEAAMSEAAERYKVAGRSTAAIRYRDSKRLLSKKR